MPFLALNNQHQSSEDQGNNQQTNRQNTCHILSVTVAPSMVTAVGLRLWNSLPAGIRQPDNDTGEFRRQLKAFLFK